MTAESGAGFREGFGRLKEYVKACGDIRIGRQSLSIPAHRREHFYRLEEDCRSALALSVLGDYGRKALKLAKRCRDTKARLISRTNLKEFCLASTLENFLKEPELTMAKPAFDIVVDGLSQDLDFHEMEERAKRYVVPFCKDLLRNAYEAWLYYGVVEAMEPVRFYGVYSPDTVEMQVVDTDTITVGFQAASPGRRMPEAIFTTGKGRAFAIKSEVAEELDFYGVKPSGCRDFSAGGNTVDQIAHRVLLVYGLESARKAPLLADREKPFLLPSDLMCEFLLPGEMERPLAAALFARRIRAVRSRRPVQVLTYDGTGEFPEGFTDDPMIPPVERRIVGENAERLREIAGILA